MNRTDESLLEMEAILQENPDHADALNFIGYTYAEMGKTWGSGKDDPEGASPEAGNGYC